MSTIIKVENLSKSYILNHEGQERYTAMRDVIANKAKKLFSFSSDHTKSATKEEFWALNDLNFEINHGDRVGIIGRNGAGKSTLLKILSRITEPSSGKISIKGRVASLLEVGTGFHPELTGRENIFLNGAILGMSRADIRRHFDAIVDFAEVEKFLDTPVKRYSSGMYVRLAFAIAAHLEPEILIVDEVLAVGDAQFQKKCLGKMEEVSKGEGRTVLFVSHNMAAVKSLCTKGILLNGGKLEFVGEHLEAILHYQNLKQTNDHFIHSGTLELAPGNENIRVIEMRVLPQEGEILNILSGVEFYLKFYCGLERKNIDVTFEVSNNDDIILFHNGILLTTQNDSKKGIYEINCRLPKQFLNAGVYSIKLIFGENQKYVLLLKESFLTFEIVHESAGANNAKLPGLTFPKLEFTTKFIN
jgi:lipopolysaccharide transport system ATP-binding protein